MFEIDFLAVGTKRSGDAIAVRYSLPSGKQRVVIVDGGDKESAEALAEHVKTVYKVSHVHLAICSHSDADHARGFARVLSDSRLTFGEVWVHQPWIRKSLSDVLEVAEITQRRVIQTFEPLSDGPLNPTFPEIVVLGPSQALYQQLRSSISLSGLSRIHEVKKSLHDESDEDPETGQLEDPPRNAVTITNMASIVWLLRLPEGDFLFTADAGVADAGVEALQDAVNAAKRQRIDLKQCKFQQIPHHGSRSNVGPTILDQLAGPADGTRRGMALVSAAPGDKHHPSTQVLDAYIERGWKVQATQGVNAWYSSADAPRRTGYRSVRPLSLFSKVEDA